MNPSDELVSFLGDIVKKTRTLEIVWVKANATTYTWRRAAVGDRPMTITTIQSAKGTRFLDFSFTVATIERNAAVTQINLTTAEKPELRGILGQLFEVARSSADSQTVKVLKDLLS